jgi:methylthioribose-1-phosphate isomerase
MSGVERWAVDAVRDRRMTDPDRRMTDPDRRRFFRVFAGDVMSSVGAVLGAAQTLQQQSAEAARELLGDETPAAAADGGPRSEEPAAGVGFRAPFRWDGDVCRIVDQRRLPEVLAELEVRGAVDAVNAIRGEAVTGGPAQAQVAAITLALIADASAASRPFARRATIRGAANALRNARQGSGDMQAAMDRMLALLDALGAGAKGATISAAMRWEAEAIIRETLDAHGALVEHALTALPAATGSPLRVVTIGSMGPMGGGQLGTAGSAIIAAHHAGRSIHALVAETRPGLAGSRVLAWELAEAGVDHVIATDAAAPGCIAAGEVDVVLAACDRVAANGDVVGVAGTYPLALAAREAGVPVIVCAPTVEIDLGRATGRDVTIEQGAPGRVLMVEGRRVAPEGTKVRSPLQDVTPASLLSAIVTERGVLRAPFEAGLMAHASGAATIRAATTNPWLAVAAAEAAEAPAETAGAAVDEPGPPGPAAAGQPTAEAAETQVPDADVGGTA